VKTGMGHKWVRNYCLNWGAYFQFEGIYWIHQATCFSYVTRLARLLLVGLPQIRFAYYPDLQKTSLDLSRCLGLYLMDCGVCRVFVIIARLF
jgi:hypothetical protein